MDFDARAWQTGGMATVEITVDGLPVATTARLAEDYGYDAGTMRKLLSRLGVRPIEHLDGRTPLYDPELVRAAIAAMPRR